jgi:hypothetical protein
VTPSEMLTRPEALNAMRLGLRLLRVGAFRLLWPSSESRLQAEARQATPFQYGPWMHLGLAAQSELSLDEVLLLRESWLSQHRPQPKHCKAEEAH